MSVDQQIKDSANQLSADVEIVHKIAHGDENTEVATEGGLVPSIKKRVKDLEENWSRDADPLATELSQVLDSAKTHDQNAAQSASTAAQQVTLTQQEGASQRTQIQDKGDSQVSRVNDEGDTQFNRVKNEGQNQLTQIQQPLGQAQQAATESGQNRQASETAMNNVMADEGSTTRAFINMTAAVIRTNTMHLDYLLATQQEPQS